MKKVYLLLIVSTFVVIFFHAHVTATVVNPDPSAWGDDDGSELWKPNDLLFKTIFYDLLGSSGYPSASGFYFESSPSELITIFGIEDQPPPQNAVVSFNDGIVVDLDTNEIQSSFVNRGENIGFFFGFQTDPNVGPIFFFTQSSLNGSFGDRVSTFSSLTNPNTYLIAFDVQGYPIALEISSDLTPVPEPSTLLLVGCGLIGLGADGNKRFWKKG